MRVSPRNFQLLNRAFELGNQVPEEKRPKAEPWMRIENNGSEATIWIYGTITSYAWWEDDVTATGVRDALEEIEASTIHLRINSPGGEVFVAVAIATLLKEDDAKIIAHVDGIAASAATTIACAADEIIIAESAQFMIHNPNVIAYGEAEDLRKTAELLDKVKGQIVNTYHKRTGIAKDKLETLMDEETWYTGEEAVEAGFADSLADGEEEEEPPEESSNSDDPPPAENKNTKTLSTLQLRHRRRQHQTTK